VENNSVEWLSNRCRELEAEAVKEKAKCDLCHEAQFQKVVKLEAENAELKSKLARVDGITAEQIKEIVENSEYVNFTYTGINHDKAAEQILALIHGEKEAV